MTQDQDLARRLGETMHRHADALHDTPLDLLAVRGRATTIRRRRHTAVGLVAAAAVAAVVLPLSLLPTGGGDRVDDPQPVDTPTPIEEPVPLDPRSAPAGPAPRVPYVEIDAKRLLTPAGAYDLPEAFPQVVPYRDGWIALTTDTPSQTGTRVAILDGGFRELEGTGMTTGIAVRDDGERVAWVEYTGTGWRLVNAPTTGGEAVTSDVTTAGPDAPSAAVGFLPGDHVVVESTDARTSRSSYRVVGPDRTTTATFGGFNHVVSSSPVNGLVAGQTEYSGDGSCSGVKDPLSASRELVWETCDHQLGAFSPDGRYVVGLAPYFDGLGSPTLAILDAATGRPVVEFVSGRSARSAAAVGDVVWEDPTTLLATVTQGVDQYVVRATIDGRVEVVAGPRPSEMSVEFRFPAHTFG
ncbi:hypothetical protein [Nocardioides sediminis]|uniref:hypothetical protein n=1 Tax=Nocardioides sediminis TaxID=433648 RepID=UPI000D30E12E|nr:hypothetical protein [Nocardioides sediminis]